MFLSSSHNYSFSLIPQHSYLILFIISWATKSSPGFCHVRFFTYLCVANPKTNKIITRRDKGTNKIWKTHTLWRNFFNYGEIWLHAFSTNRLNPEFEMQTFRLSVQWNQYHIILRACEYVKRVDDAKEKNELPDNNFNP